MSEQTDYQLIQTQGLLSALIMQLAKAGVLKDEDRQEIFKNAADFASAGHPNEAAALARLKQTFGLD